MTAQQRNDGLIPDPIVARERYHVNPRTLRRWDANPDLKFAPPIIINGRRYRRRADLEQFETRAHSRARNGG
jgi:hypothetical protein